MPGGEVYTCHYKLSTLTPFAPAEYFQVDSLSAKTVPFATFSRRKFGVDDIVVIYLGPGVS